MYMYIAQVSLRVTGDATRPVEVRPGADGDCMDVGLKGMAGALAD